MFLLRSHKATQIGALQFLNFSTSAPYPNWIDCTSIQYPRVPGFMGCRNVRHLERCAAPATWLSGSSTRLNSVVGSQRAMTNSPPTTWRSSSLRWSGYGCATSSNVPRPRWSATWFARGRSRGAARS